MTKKSMLRLEVGNDNYSYGQSSSVFGASYRSHINLSRKNSTLGKKPLRLGWLVSAQSSENYTVLEGGVGASVLMKRRPWGWSEGSIRVYGAGLASHISTDNGSETDPVLYVGVDWRYWDELAWGWEYYVLGYSGMGWSIRYLF